MKQFPPNSRGKDSGNGKLNLKSKELKETFWRAAWTNNPTFVQAIGLCPTLAVSNSAINGLGMGIAATFVLLGSNTLVSLLRKFTPSKIRIPIFITVIASFVTLVEMIMKGYFPVLDKALGIFIPLIVVNCIILARAESFASKNDVLKSIADALGTGLGFTAALLLLGITRELLGNGTVFGVRILPEQAKIIMFLLPPGAFLTMGFYMALFNRIAEVRASKSGGKK